MMTSSQYTYKTIIGKGESYFFDRGSKFLGFSIAVNNQEQIKNELKKLKGLHPKANHFCYAWRLGNSGNEFRTNDHGEPSGSSGRPILGQIDHNGLTNVLVVVIRYFGGTLLGIPGLINAYKTAASECLSNATIIEKEITEDIQIYFDYTSLNVVIQLIRKYNATIQAKKEELFCTYTIALSVARMEEFLKETAQQPGLKINEQKL